MEIVHFKIWVKGKVQGVWFRKYTREEALRLGLNGFVRNEPGGDVYTEVEGAHIKVKNFINWLYEGSPGSEVKEVIHIEGEPVGFEGFEIRR